MRDNLREKRGTGGTHGIVDGQAEARFLPISNVLQVSSVCRNRGLTFSRCSPIGYGDGSLAMHRTHTDDTKGLEKGAGLTDSAASYNEAMVGMLGSGLVTFGSGLGLLKSSIVMWTPTGCKSKC